MTSPLAAAIIDWVDGEVRRAPSAPLLMVSGAQGIGKSSAMSALAARDDLRVVALGLDDFYLTLSDRQALGARIHPLCETRGPPGTHDLGVLADVVEALLNGPASQPVRAPRFDKRRDDRVDRDGWALLAARPDAILLEGWMMGALSDPTSASSAPINSLEASEDSQGVWRGWQEAALAEDYGRLWDRARAVLHLRAPSFGIVSAWRRQQEEVTLGLQPGALPADRGAWVDRFIQHYERITRRMLNGAVRPGAVIRVSEARVPIG